MAGRITWVWYLCTLKSDPVSQFWQKVWCILNTTVECFVHYAHILNIQSIMKSAQTKQKCDVTAIKLHLSLKIYFTFRVFWHPEQQKMKHHTIDANDFWTLISFCCLGWWSRLSCIKSTTLMMVNDVQPLLGIN